MTRSGAALSSIRHSSLGSSMPASDTGRDDEMPFTASDLPLLAGGVMMNEELEERGIISLISRYSVVETATLITAALQADGITIFAVIDQRKEAEKVGLALRPTQLIIFGDPKT